MNSLGGRNFIRSRKIVHNGIDKGLYTCVAAASSTKEGDKVLGNGTTADFLYQGFQGNLLSHQEKLCNLIIVGSNLVNKLFTPLIG